MTITVLEKMWEEFGDISIHSDDETEIDFYWLIKGANRFDNWHWFYEKFTNGVSEYAI